MFCLFDDDRYTIIWPLRLANDSTTTHTHIPPSHWMCVCLYQNSWIFMRVSRSWLHLFTTGYNYSPKKKTSWLVFSSHFRGNQSALMTSHAIHHLPFPHFHISTNTINNCQRYFCYHFEITGFWFVQFFFFFLGKRLIYAKEKRLIRSIRAHVQLT